MMKKITYLLLLVYLLSSCDLMAQEIEKTNQRKTDQSGRTGLLIFSGYYGWWMGIVSHLVWDVGIEIKNNEKTLPLTPVITTSATLLTAHYITRNRSFSNAQSSLLALGGHLGTWQGLGWSAISDVKKNANLNYGFWSGMAGIASGIITYNLTDFSDGGALLTHGSMFWGLWFGYAAGKFLNHKKDDLLSDMLISSNVFVLGTGYFFRESALNRGNVYGINALGYLNGVIFWLLYWSYTAENDTYSGKTALGWTTAGSVTGLLLGAYLVSKRNIYSSNLFQNNNFSFKPDVIYIQSQHKIVRLLPALNLKYVF